MTMSFMLTVSGHDLSCPLAKELYRYCLCVEFACWSKYLILFSLPGFRCQSNYIQEKEKEELSPN